MCTLVLWGGILGEAGSGATIVFDVCRGSSGVYELIAAAPGMRGCLGYLFEVWLCLSYWLPQAPWRRCGAAVQNGADAVYLGAGAFHARQGARNFTVETLREAVQYAHVRGVAVHLTLNTLVLDRECQQAAELIRAAARAGVDALIVQDLGILALCRQIAPHIPIHASTQMSIHSLDGVYQAAALGVSRVILARELPREEIARICRNSPVEIEVFVHGAFCMCYSGQCYMSGVIGRRSGNRGQCAQPCRLPYGYGRFEDRYPLSLRTIVWPLISGNWSRWA